MDLAAELKAKYDQMADFPIVCHNISQVRTICGIDFDKDIYQMQQATYHSLESQHVSSLVIEDVFDDVHEELRFDDVNAQFCDYAYEEKRVVVYNIGEIIPRGIEANYDIHYLTKIEECPNITKVSEMEYQKMCYWMKMSNAQNDYMLDGCYDDKYFTDKHNLLITYVNPYMEQIIILNEKRKFAFVNVNGTIHRCLFQVDYGSKIFTAKKPEISYVLTKSLLQQLLIDLNSQKMLKLIILKNDLLAIILITNRLIQIKMSTMSLLEVLQCDIRGIKLPFLNCFGNDLQYNAILNCIIAQKITTVIDQFDYSIKEFRYATNVLILAIAGTKVKKIEEKIRKGVVNAVSLNNYYNNNLVYKVIDYVVDNFQLGIVFPKVRLCTMEEKRNKNDVLIKEIGVFATNDGMMLDLPKLVQNVDEMTVLLCDTDYMFSAMQLCNVPDNMYQNYYSSEIAKKMQMKDFQLLVKRFQNLLNQRLLQRKRYDIKDYFKYVDYMIKNPKYICEFVVDFDDDVMKLIKGFLNDFVTFEQIQDHLMFVKKFISYRRIVDYVNYGLDIVKIVENKVTKVRLKYNKI